MVYTIRNIKRCNILDEIFVVILQDRIIKHVVHEIIDKLDTILHLVEVNFHTRVYKLQLHQDFIYE